MRPQYHFTAQKNWINDPNGIIYYNGHYHLFYQHFPYECHWGTMHWGHATTTDFIHFTHYPIALYPSKTFDQNGCFSGSSIYYNNQLYIYYTAIQYKSINIDNIHIRNAEDDTYAIQALIRSDDGFSFNNNEKKEIIIKDYPQSRDPKAWIGKDGCVYLIIGSSFNNVPTVLFYKSHDGIHFQEINQYQNKNLGTMWECPAIFKINNQYFLTVSPENIFLPPKPNCASVVIPIHFQEETCTISNVQPYQLMDYGLDFYAPYIFEDENSQPTLLAWMRMRQPFQDESWVGMFCMPRILEEKNGYLYQNVHPHIKRHFVLSKQIPTLHHPFKIDISLYEGQSINFGNFIIKIRNDHLICDRSLTSIQHKKVCNVNSSPKLNLLCNLEIYYDYGIFEIFINNGQYVMSQIVYNLDLNIIQLPHQSYKYYMFKKNK